VQGTVEVIDPVVQLALEPLGQAVPVLGPGDVAFGQLSQGDADLGDGQAHPLAGADHGDATQDIAVVTALVAGGAVATDQSLPLVEPSADGATPLRSATWPTVSPASCQSKDPVSMACPPARELALDFNIS
jgi:hypothetical protein